MFLFLRLFKINELICRIKDTKILTVSNFCNFPEFGEVIVLKINVVKSINEGMSTKYFIRTLGMYYICHMSHTIPQNKSNMTPFHLKVIHLALSFIPKVALISSGVHTFEL